MNNFKVGDVVSRKSYNGDISFIITDIAKGDNGKPIYILRGLLHRIQADADEDDLVKQTYRNAYSSMTKDIIKARQHSISRKRSSRLIRINKFRSRPGRILHVDSSREFIDICVRHYSEAGLKSVAIQASESEQPGLIRKLLERYMPDILVVTGHDGFKKDTSNRDSADRYRNSKYFIQSVKEARKYESSYDNLCIFAGACQSYYEGIMDVGANFASSPGRILINALDPAIVAEKVALTDSRSIVTPSQVADATISGRDGIWGINTKGHLIVH